jgi:microcystin-dependent protein
MNIFYLQLQRLVGTSLQETRQTTQGGGMTDVFVGQIMMTGFGFAQRGFAQCNGQIMAIQQNQALFSLIGTSYGGNGVSTFQLPDLQGNALYGAGSSVDGAWQPAPQPTGEVGGSETVNLALQNLPIHNHLLNATTTAGTASRSAVNALIGTAAHSIYGPPTGANVQLATPTLQFAGGGLPHDNVQPFLVINFNIALSGIFPSRN